MYICETCREQVMPASEGGLVYAVEIKRADSMGSTEYLEGLGVFFHERCYPAGSPHYRRKPMPEDIGDGDDK